MSVGCLISQAGKHELCSFSSMNFMLYVGLGGVQRWWRGLPLYHGEGMLRVPNRGALAICQGRGYK